MLARRIVIVVALLHLGPSNYRALSVTVSSSSLLASWARDNDNKIILGLSRADADRSSFVGYLLHFYFANFRGLCNDRNGFNSSHCPVQQIVMRWWSSGRVLMVLLCIVLAAAAADDHQPGWTYDRQGQGQRHCWWCLLVHLGNTIRGGWCSAMSMTDRIFMILFVTIEGDLYDCNYVAKYSEPGLWTRFEFIVEEL